MHGGHQAAPVGTAHDGGIRLPVGRPAPPGQLRPPGLLPVAAAGPPGIAARAVGIEPESPRAAREFARETLLSWDMSAAFQDTAVVVSELVTNALCHGARVVAGEMAPGQVELSLWHRASHLVCAVTDPSAEPACGPGAGGHLGLGHARLPPEGGVGSPARAAGLRGVRGDPASPGLIPGATPGTTSVGREFSPWADDGLPGRRAFLGANPLSACRPAAHRRQRKARPEGT